MEQGLLVRSSVVVVVASSEAFAVPLAFAAIFVLVSPEPPLMMLAGVLVVAMQLVLGGSCEFPVFGVWSGHPRQGEESDINESLALKQGVAGMTFADGFKDFLSISALSDSSSWILKLWWLSPFLKHLLESSLYVTMITAALVFFWNDMILDTKVFISTLSLMHPIGEQYKVS